MRAPCSAAQTDCRATPIMMRTSSTVRAPRDRILRIPYKLFWILLYVYAWFDKDPPFTTGQLEALVIPESFPVIDWPGIFDVRPTPFRDAIEETFHDPTYSSVVLEF